MYCFWKNYGGKYRGVFSKAVRTWSQLAGFVFTNPERTARRSEVYGLLQVGGASFWCILVRRSCHFALWGGASICNSPRYFFNALQARNRGLLLLGELQMKLKIRLLVTVLTICEKTKGILQRVRLLALRWLLFQAACAFPELRFLRFQQGARHRSKMGRCIQIVVKNFAPLGFLHPPAFSKLLGRSLCENRAAFHAPATEYGWACSSLAAFCISNAPAQSPPTLFIKPPPMPTAQANCILFIPRVKGVLRF